MSLHPSAARGMRKEVPCRQTPFRRDVAVELEGGEVKTLVVPDQVSNRPPPDRKRRARVS
jgi:hypothetical protein